VFKQSLLLCVTVLLAHYPRV